MAVNLIGLLGIIFLVLAWLPISIRTLSKKRSNENLLFGILFLIGAAFLTVYSIQIKDVIFSVLNLLAMIFAFINIEYIPRKSEVFEHEIEEIVGRKGKKYYHIKKAGK